MSKLHLNAIVTRALVDDEFKAAILNGQRKARLAAFELTEQERNTILSIESHDLDQFIGQLERWMRISDWTARTPGGMSGTAN
jgi:hypothetical protein